MFGFSSISAPEITTDYQEISEANWIFKKKILKKGDVSNITMTRGVTFYDSDFWHWIMAGLTGDMTGLKFNIGPLGIGGIPIGGYTPRRMLMLVQFFTRSPFNPGTVGTAALEAGLYATGAALSGASLVSVLSVGTLEFGAAALLSSFGVGPFEFAARVPARAWLLHNCMPARYKASGDFDATSSALSIAELEFSVEMMEEISLAS